MAKEVVEALVDGGKASAGPPLGSTLGPMRVNIGQVITEINKKTSAFAGMKVPVKVIVDVDTKEFEIEVGTPPVSQLLQKELGIEKGSGKPNVDKVGNIAIEQVIKVAKMKYDSMLVKDLRAAVKSIAGSCNSMGLLIEGVGSKELNQKIDAGEYDDFIKKEKTETSEEKKQQLKQQLEEVKKRLEAELKAREEMEKEILGVKEEEKKEEVVTEKVEGEKEGAEKAEEKGEKSKVEKGKEAAKETKAEKGKEFKKGK